MDFNAKIRLVVNVPFQFDVDDAPAIELEPSPRREGALTLKDKERYETIHRNIEQQRELVAKHAEEIARSLNVAEGQIVGVLVEEVVEQ